MTHSMVDVDELLQVVDSNQLQPLLSSSAKQQEEENELKLCMESTICTYVRCCMRSYLP